ncbi:MAG: competence protein ComEC [Clostridia bacterium]|nr:competence protein ComEC [Clostridia bacterium]
MEEPKIYPNRVLYTLEVKEIRQGNYRRKVKEKVEVVQYYPKQAKNKTNPEKQQPFYHYGDILKIHGQLKLPPQARNPGEFDYRAYLARRYIYTRMAVEDPLAISKIGSVVGNPLRRLALSAKGKVAAAITRALPPREAAVLQALLFGDKEQLDENDVEAFQNLGIMHLLAVSGSNVGFVLLLVMTVAGLLGLGRGAAVMLGLGGLFFYAALCGFTSSVTRASIMAGLGLLAYRERERRDFYTALALAALFILFFNPRSLYESGFQLSFVATWGIVYFYPLFDGLLARLPSWRSYLAAALAAQLAVLPLQVYYFNLIPCLGLPVNIITLGLAGVLVITGLAASVLVLLFPPLAYPLLLAAGVIIHFLLALLSKMASLPGAVLSVGTPGPALILGYYILAAAFREIYLHRQEPRLLWFWRWQGQKVVLLGLTAAALFLWLPRQGRDDFKIVFLDVGQGDAIYIHTPRGKNILVDGGGRPYNPDSNFDVGEDIVVPFLRRQGVRRLDLVVSTHPDADHLGGLAAVIRQLPVSLVITPPPGAMFPDYKDFLVEVAARKINWAVAGRGDKVVIDPDLEILVLHPGREIKGSRADGNNNSLVLRLGHGRNTFLLAGDIETEAMADLVATDLPLRSTVFKVPHHGSRYGLKEDFLAAVDPEAVIISAGADNNFGHPAPEILAYWQREGAKIYRTDRQGAITITSDGESWQVKPFISPK